MDGFHIDEPMLALIARFAACCNDLDVSDETFLRRHFGAANARLGKLMSAGRYA